MKTTDKTRVIFRKFPDGDIIALFPSLPGDAHPSTCLSYMHIGQHSAASADLATYTLPATPDEYAPLLAELRSIGYFPVVAQRATRHDYEMRRQACRFEFTPTKG